MSREIYGVLIGIFTLAVIVLPVPLFLVAVGVLSLLISREISSHLGTEEVSPVGFFAPLFFYLDVSIGMVFSFLVSLAYGYVRWNLDSMIRSLFLIVFVGFFPSYLIHIKEEGTYFILVFFLSLWASDVAAYYVGRSMGRTPLFPKISPKKTLEGFLGGLVAGLLVFTVLSDLPLLRSVLVGVIFLTAGVVGDYFKSFLKRHFGIKDFSNVLGGHGGFTDRFDSAIFSAPLYYWLIVRP